jgi:hypothetical protein
VKICDKCHLDAREVWDELGTNLLFQDESALNKFKKKSFISESMKARLGGNQ